MAARADCTSSGRPTTAEAMAAVADAGADFVGLNFYPPSPRAVTPAEAAALIAAAPAALKKVGLFVDPDDEGPADDTADAESADAESADADDVEVTS